MQKDFLQGGLIQSFIYINLEKNSCVFLIPLSRWHSGTAVCEVRRIHFPGSVCPSRDGDRPLATHPTLLTRLHRLTQKNIKFLKSIYLEILKPDHLNIY